jgi:hypothetical protein
VIFAPELSLTPRLPFLFASSRQASATRCFSAGSVKVRIIFYRAFRKTMFSESNCFYIGAFFKC